MRCPVCGDETGIEVGGEPFCVFCENLERSYRAQEDHQCIYRDSVDAVRGLLGACLFGLLVYAAIYVLIKW